MQFEKNYVHAIYSKIAKEFDATRYSRWPCVTHFLDTLPSGVRVLDLGCGNGKYLSYRNDIMMYGIDACHELIQIAQTKHKDAILTCGNCLDLPYQHDYFDYVISVAVLHHISSVERRHKFMQEITRVLKPDGKVLISVWTPNVKQTWKSIGDGDYLIPWKSDHQLRYYHLFEISELIELAECYFDIEITYEKENWILYGTMKQV